MAMFKLWNCSTFLAMEYIQYKKVSNLNENSLSFYELHNLLSTWDFHFDVHG